MIATDDIAGRHYQYVKLAHGPEDTATIVDVGAAALPIQDGGNSITVDGSVTAIAQPGVDIGDVTINNASLTVDAPAGTPVAVQPSDGVTAQTYAEIDTDTGAPTVNRIAVGLIAPGSGGQAVIPGTAADGLLVNLGSNNDVTITGAVDTELPAAVALADDLANPTAPSIGAHLLVFDGVAWDRAPGTTADGLLVNLGGNNDVSITGAVDTELPAAIALADDMANPTAPQVGAHLMLFDGSAWDRAPGTAEDGLLVNLGANNDVTVASGNITVDAPVGTPANVQISDGVDTVLVDADGNMSALNATNSSTGTLTAAGQNVALTDLKGMGSGAIQLSGTWTAGVKFECSVNGTNWQSLHVMRSNTTSLTVNATTNGIFLFNCVGATQVRARADTHSSGTVTVDINVSIGSGKILTPISTDAAGASTLGYLVQGDDGTYARNVATDAAGHLQVDVLTFPDNEPFDVAQIAGTATSTGNGTVDAGTQRVAIASDNTAFTVNIGTFPDNEPFDLNQVGGNAILTGNGVTGTGSPRVTIASNNTAFSVNAEQATAANLNAQVVGDLAHDAADSTSNPTKVGGRSIDHGANPTAVAAADRTNWYFNRAGVPFVIGGHMNAQTIRATYTTAQTDTAIVTVAGGLKIVVTRCSMTLDNAASVDVAARIGFAAATTPTTTDVVCAHGGIPAGGGIQEGNGGGILGVGADGEDLRITSDAPTSGQLDVVVTYYTIEG